jgi:hypothetical protein
LAEVTSSATSERKFSPGPEEGRIRGNSGAPSKLIAPKLNDFGQFTRLDGGSLHDWSSHTRDAFGSLAIFYEEPPVDEPPPFAPVEQLTYRHYFDVRLGLAPVGAPGNIRLVFDQRRVGELWEVQQPANPDEGTDAIENWRAYAPDCFLPVFSIERMTE